MKNTLFTLLACIVMMFGFSTHTFAADFPEQACSNFTVNGTQPDNINSCDQCFDGGFVYEDKGMTLTDAYVNNNSDDHIFYIDENPSVYEYKTLQSSSVWATGPSTKMLEPTSNMVLQTGRSGRDYFRFKPGRTNFLQTIPGNGVKLLSVGTGTIRNNPAYRFVFDLNSRLFDGVSAPQALVNHRECVFFKAARCGDGVVDTDQGETCDSGALNGTGVGCSATCQTVPMTNYDLALTKRVVGSDTSFAPGETVEYNITVHNQGNQPANGIVISDYVPAGLTIIDPNWTVVGGTGTRTITGPILPGNTASVVLRARVESSFTGSQIVNWAEISVDDGDDVDSTPDQSNVNDCHGGDGGSGTGIGNIDQDADNNILSTGNTTLHSGDQDGDGICEQGEDEDDHDPALISIIQSRISIDKTDANPADRDGVQGDDRQTVLVGSGAIFQITVRNDSAETLTGVVITDALEPLCNQTAAQTANLISTQIAGGVFAAGTSFTYSCTDAVVPATYTNNAAVTAQGVTSGNTVTDDDNSQVFAISSALTFTKTDLNPADRDGVQRNDTQTVMTGATAIFEITVENTGTQPITGFSIIDANTPNCAATPTLSGSSIGNTGAWTNVTASGVVNGELVQSGRISFTCTQPSVSGDFTNTAIINATTSVGPLSSTDDSVVRVETYDLALTKTVSGSTNVFTRGDSVTFNVVVENQGTIAANNITVIDYIPTGLTLNDTAWTLNGNRATRVISTSIAAGANVVLPITFTVDSTATGLLQNWAEISVDDGPDTDSTPDSTLVNDCHGITDFTSIPVSALDAAANNRTDGRGDANGNGICEAGEDEDDHDVEQINILIPSVSIVKTDSNVDDLDRGVVDTQLVHAGSGATFRITLTNDGSDNLTNIEVVDALGASCAGPVALSGTGVSTPGTWTGVTFSGIVGGQLVPNGTLSYNCTVDNTTVAYTNTGTVTASGALTTRSVTASDGSDVVLAPIAGITVDKVDANVNDLDGGVADSQTVFAGSGATFGITVTNSGTDSLTNITLSDQLGVACQGPVTLTGTTIIGQPGWSNLTATGIVNGQLSPTGSFSYNCTVPATASGYINSISVAASGAISLRDASDTDTSAVVLAPVQAISINKVDANPADLDGGVVDSQMVASGSVATFGITVTNTGTDSLRNIVLSDALANNCAGNVTLSGSTLTGETTWLNLTSTGVVNGLLTPSGSFSYTCNGPITASGYTNEAIVTASGAITNRLATARDTSVVVLAPAPGILVTKTDANPADTDGTIGDDTQTVASGAVATFGITVRNTAADNLRNIVLADALGPNCSGTPTLSGSTLTGEATWSNLTSTGIVNGQLTQSGSFSYTCNGPATSTGYTNEIIVTASGVTASGSLTSSDQSVVVLAAPTPGTMLVSKTDANPADTDGTIGDDTQTVASGAVATFGITVTNTGTENLRNIVLADALGANCSGTPTLSGSTLTGETTWSNLTSTGIVNGELTQSGSFSYTCNGPATSTGYTNEIIVTASGVTSGASLSVADQSAVVLATAPVATCDSLTATPILGAPGFTSALTCSATNATSYQINCGNGTTINSSTGSCTYTTPQTFVASCTINGSITAPTCQQAIDSVPPAAVTQVVAISKTDANPADTDGTIGNDTQTITSGGTATFRITVTNNGTETLRNFTVADPLGTTCAGSATLSGATVLGATGWSNITSTGVVNGSLIPTGNFSYECSTAGITASYTNTASVSAFGASTNSGTSLSDSSAVVVTTGGGGPGPTGGGLGGSTRLACENMVFNVSALNADNIEIHNDRFLTFSGATVTVPVECQGNVKVNYFKVDCGNGVITGSKRVEPDTHNQTFECIYNKRASEPTYFPKCLASNTSDENFRGNAVQCSGKVTLGAGFCGDGQVQSGEQCDLGSENGTICTNSCKLDLNVNLSTQPGVKTPGVITLPRGGKILITPNSGSKVIGNGQSVFDIGEIAEVKNESEHEINLEGEELCVSSSNSRLVSGGQRCSSSIKWLYPGHTQKVILEDKFIGKTSGIANGKRYQDTEVITTLGDLRTAFFAGTTKVRVTKPSISTVGGGTSLIKDTSGITKLDDVVEGNTNFEGAGVGTDGFGSTTNVTGDNVDTIGTSDGINLDIIDTSEATTQFTNYNGIDNVFIIKGTDTTIGSDFLDDASGARTYIIEDADLIIDGNIDYSSNIAFVVRGGDIRVKDSVTQIDGTYIAIKKNNTGGSISSDKTSNQLVVDGSLYGDISELVDNRTYVKQNGDGQLDVGTIISFASNLFRKPAPLVGKFINEYTSSEKTAE